MSSTNNLQSFKSSYFQITIINEYAILYLFKLKLPFKINWREVICNNFLQNVRNIRGVSTYQVRRGRKHMFKIFKEEMKGLIKERIVFFQWDRLLFQINQPWQWQYHFNGSAGQWTSFYKAVDFLPAAQRHGQAVLKGMMRDGRLAFCSLSAHLTFTNGLFGQILSSLVNFDFLLNFWTF